tara:strand:- start:18 stop:776 length:759 start_codon:yes stop_codon:yes gene_type:complete
MEEENKELEENFLSRWSKKKSKQKTQIENSNSKQTDPESSTEAENQSSLDEENDKLNDEELLKKYNLPNPEKIKTEKSLDVFFKDGVPDRLRQIALRRVWRLNPIIRFADAEINDYHEDFTDAATVIEGMQTAYKVGKGYLSDLIEDNNESNENESLVSKDASLDKKNTKKIKKISEKKNIEKIKNEEPKQIFNKENKETSQNGKKIIEAENFKEQSADENKEKEASLEHVERKPKPQNMVFKPKKINTDYQ